MTRAWIWLRRPQVALILICGILYVAPLEAWWVARPGTVKVYATKRQRGIPVDPRLVRLLQAEIVDDDDGSFLLQLPLPNASASPSILSEVAQTVAIRNDLDILDFIDMPIDAREPPPVYPAPWAAGPARPGSREAFVVQFATSPRQAWVSELESTGATILDPAVQNGYVVIGDEMALERFALRLPVQLLRRHQPYHRVSRHLRETRRGTVAIEISVAAVPEKAAAEDFIIANAIARIRPPEPAGDRTIFRITIDASKIPALASFAAVNWIDFYAPPRPSPGPSAVRLGITNNTCQVSPCPGPITPPPPSAGSPFSIFLMGLDASNALKDISGVTVSFSSSDPLATLPGNYSFVPADHGIRSFVNGAVLRTPGIQSITVSDVSGAIAPATVLLTVTNAPVGPGIQQIPTIGEVARLLLLAALALSGAWISYRNV